MKVYVATSWRNLYQQGVVMALREAGHEVYDFRDEGFGWQQVDPDWQKWTPEQYRKALDNPIAVAGFDRDMNALIECDVCVAVMPFGPSAGMELGWAAGAGRFTIVYVPELREADLMVKMSDRIALSMDEVVAALAKVDAEMTALEVVKQLTEGA